jgi:hypothetical protein
MSDTDGAVRHVERLVCLMLSPYCGGLALTLVVYKPVPRRGILRQLQSPGRRSPAWGLGSQRRMSLRAVAGTATQPAPMANLQEAFWHLEIVKLRQLIRAKKIITAFEVACVGSFSK